MPDGRPCPRELDADLQAFVDAVQKLVIATEHAVRQQDATCLLCRDARQAALRALDKAAILRRSWLRLARGEQRPR